MYKAYFPGAYTEYFNYAYQQCSFWKRLFAPYAYGTRKQFNTSRISQLYP